MNTLFDLSTIDASPRKACQAAVLSFIREHSPDGYSIVERFGVDGMIAAQDLKADGLITWRPTQTPSRYKAEVAI